jgi:hopanoid biosynthesis associated protein HpnK
MAAPVHTAAEMRSAHPKAISTERRLIVNADDFGRSHSINEAVLRAHRSGILTTASLMVNEPSAAEAVEMARDNPNLGVGLHLTLTCGKSALPHREIPNLVDENGEFSNDPVAVGWRYFASRKLRPQLRDEIQAQFEKFHATGLTLDHVNGHLNLHLHPVIFSLLMENAGRWKIRAMRLTRDPFRLNAKLANGNWAYRTSHALIFTILSQRARPRLLGGGISHTRSVFGLLQNGKVDTAYVHALLPRLPAGDSELYSHPSLDQFKAELEALTDSSIKNLVGQLRIRLIRYQDL